MRAIYNQALLFETPYTLVFVKILKEFQGNVFCLLFFMFSENLKQIVTFKKQ